MLKGPAFRGEKKQDSILLARLSALCNSHQPNGCKTKFFVAAKLTWKIIELRGCISFTIYCFQHFYFIWHILISCPRVLLVTVVKNNYKKRFLKTVL